jgi:hypothetical protein
MDVTIYGKPSKCQRKIIRKAAHFYGSCLISNRLSRNVYVTIKFKKNLFKKEDFYGVCDALDLNRPRDFDIEIDADLTFKQTLSVLAHELVHVKQYVTGQLKDYNTSKKIKWKGNIHFSEHGYGIIDTTYWDAPWEKEAYRLEKTLTRKFMKHLMES